MGKRGLMRRWLIEEQTIKKPSNLYVIPELVMEEGAGDASFMAASKHSSSHPTTHLPMHSPYILPPLTNTPTRLPTNPYKHNPQTTTMSAPNAGRQSPEPERLSGAQAG